VGAKSFWEVPAGILGYMSTERGAAMPGPDDFDRQLRELTSGSAGTARFREPSAAERAEGAIGPPVRRRRPVTNWRQASRARKLRRPVTPGSGGASGRRTPWSRASYLLRRPPASRRAPARSPRQRLRSLAKGAAILVGFAALLFLMHVLGLGPR
jgi:hypothetical protein